MRPVARVLVVVAHPDDAELALGGAIAKWCQQGHEVTVACCSVAERTAVLATRRREAAAQAARILGHELRWLTHEDVRRVEDMPEHRLVGQIDALVRDLQSDVVVCHWDGDPHGDHRRVASAVLSSARTWPEAALLQFGPNEHRSPVFGNFSPTVLIPVSKQLGRKAEALAAYHYHDYSFQTLDIEGVALRNRALGSQIGVPAAEGLRLLRVTAHTRGAAGLAALLADSTE